MSLSETSLISSSANVDSKLLEKIVLFSWTLQFEIQALCFHVSFDNISKLKPPISFLCCVVVDISFAAFFVFVWKYFRRCCDKIMSVIKAWIENSWIIEKRSVLVATSIRQINSSLEGKFRKEKRKSRKNRLSGEKRKTFQQLRELYFLWNN